MTRIPIVTFSTGYGSTAVEIDAELLRTAEQALEEERQRQAREPAAEARTKPTTEPPTRTVLGVLGAKASGFF